MEVFGFPHRPGGISKIKEIGTICWFREQLHSFKTSGEDSVMIFNHYFSEKQRELSLLVVGEEKDNYLFFEGGWFFNR